MQAKVVLQIDYHQKGWPLTFYSFLRSEGETDPHLTMAPISVTAKRPEAAEWIDAAAMAKYLEATAGAIRRAIQTDNVNPAEV